MINGMFKIPQRFKSKRFLKNLAFFCATVLVFFVGAVTIWISSFKIPDFSSFEDRKLINSTKIYDRTGQILLYDIHQDVKRTDVSFAEMGANIKNATVAVEDADFYNHSGIRITSILRAGVKDLLGIGRTQGGSTITQQLVKNTLLNPKKTLTRKIKEWVLAIKIDRSLPKEKILEYYLNENPYGGNLYGIEEASKTYFGKEPADLTLAEAAYLAAIPQSPTFLSPYGKNKARLDERKDFVLGRMLAVKFITESEYNQAKSEVVNFLPQQTTGIKAPHFVFFIRQYLEEKYGADALVSGGLKVTTTLDYALEEKAEQFVKDGALQNEKAWGGNNAALVAIDPKTGQILSMVGSRGYFDKEIDGNYNVATASRQPGSSFKPFIYATAFNKGFTEDTVLFDLPTEFQTTCNAYGKATAGHDQSDCYMPDNYDGKSRGPMKLKDALAQSINVPAVKLFYLAGTKDSLATAEDMGISTLTDPGRYGLTLVIGGGEVTLLDMTSAYGVFANNGVRNPYTGILKVEDTRGEVLEEYAPREKEILPKNTALMISDILSDNTARIPTFGANSALVVPGKEVAVKTGTTNNNKDAWTIGYTPSVVVGVWAGNNDNKPMKKGGVSVAGPMWNKFMTEVLKILPDENFEKPEPLANPESVKPALRGFWQGNETFVIDTISGKLATEATPPETRKEKSITSVHSILYWVSKNDIPGPPPANPGNDPQFSHWEIPVQSWWAQNASKYGVTTWAEKPVGDDDVHTNTSKLVITIVSPTPSAVYPKNQTIYLQITNSGNFPIQKVDVFINAEYIGSYNGTGPFPFTPAELRNLKEVNDLKIIAYDFAFNRTEVNATFRVAP